MIYNLCNIGNEQNATFNRASIIKKTSVPAFNHLASDATIQQHITNISVNSDAINLDLLPENLSHNQNTRTSADGTTYNVSARTILTPLDKNLQQLLEGYNNQEVLLLLEKPGVSFLYGTPTSPLIFTYNEQHNNTAQGLKGYGINISGECLGASKQFETIVFDIFDRGLAFQLAGSL